MHDLLYGYIMELFIYIFYVAIPTSTLICSCTGVTWITVPCYTLLVVVVAPMMTGSTKSHQTVRLG